MCKGLGDGAYGLSSLSEKTITKAALSPQLFKDPECWSGRGLNLRPPAQQTGALPTELTGNPSFTDEKSGIQFLEPGIRGVESRRFALVS